MFKGKEAASIDVCSLIVYIKGKETSGSLQLVKAVPHEGEITFIGVRDPTNECAGKYSEYNVRSTWAAIRSVGADGDPESSATTAFDQY